MTNRVRRAGMLAVAALALPAALAAQVRPMSSSAPGARAGAVPEAVRNWDSELRQLAARLQAAHTRAMEDPQLRATHGAFMRDVKAAMDRADPELARLVARMPQMEQEMLAARNRGDQARFQSLYGELRRIQQRVLRVQNTVLGQPAFASRARALEQRLHARMVQVEPATDSLLSRSQDLQQRIMRAMGITQPRQAPQHQH